MIGAYLEEECNELFIAAKKKQENINKYKPTWENQSWEIANFYDAPAKNSDAEITLNFKIRLARREDVPAIVAMLAEDSIGKLRESLQKVTAISENYYRAFDDIRKVAVVK